MRFLGRVLAGSSRFLGHGMRTARYIGRALPAVASGISYGQTLLGNRAIQSAAERVGVDPSVFRAAHRIGDAAQGALALVPGIASGARDAAQNLHTAVTDAGRSLAPARRSLADLYRDARG